MKNRGTEIFSIFGQIEAAAAETMIKEGAIRIDAKDIPLSAAWNEEGQRAKFAIILQRSKLRAFEKLIADLRA